MRSRTGKSCSVFLFTRRIHKTITIFIQLTAAYRQSLCLTVNHYLQAIGGLTATGANCVVDNVYTVPDTCVVTDARTVKENGWPVPHSVPETAGGRETVTG